MRVLNSIYSMLPQVYLSVPPTYPAKRNKKNPPRCVAGLASTIASTYLGACHHAIYIYIYTLTTPLSLSLSLSLNACSLWLLAVKKAVNGPGYLPASMATPRPKIKEGRLTKVFLVALGSGPSVFYEVCREGRGVRLVEGGGRGSGGRSSPRQASCGEQPFYALTFVLRTFCSL